jgi:hypothetical protein
MTTATEASAATGGDAHPGGDDLGDIFVSAARAP